MTTTSHLSFDGLGLSAAILRELARVGYRQPTPIQHMAIPPALAGHDIIGCAQTGTGKTAAFVIPMIERLAGGQGTRALILAPTRELAMQIHHTIEQLGRSRRVSSTLVVGGADILLAETSFDTLNMKACLYALSQVFLERGVSLPVMVSGTIFENNRTLFGQSMEAFWASVSHFPMFATGFNCAVGPKQIRPYIEAISQIAPLPIICYPNAGMPDGMGGFQSNPVEFTQCIREFAEYGWVNLSKALTVSSDVYFYAVGNDFWVQYDRNEGGDDSKDHPVGYGLQSVVPTLQADLVRYRATVGLVDVKGTAGIPSGTAVMFTNNPGKKNTGGTCFGDSGGPVFFQGTDVIAAVTSFGLNFNCVGVGGGYRMDTSDDQAFVAQFLD